MSNVETASTMTPVKLSALVGGVSLKGRYGKLPASPLHRSFLVQFGANEPVVSIVHSQTVKVFRSERKL